MSDGREAGPGGQRGASAVVPPCLAVVVGWGNGTGQVFRVDAPDRVLRVWAMLGNAADDLRQAALPSEVIARLSRQLDAAVAELETSVSPALAGELHRLTRPGKSAELSTDELRVEYATVLAWTASLLTEVLSQIHDAAARTAQGRGLRAPARGQDLEGPTPLISVGQRDENAADRRDQTIG